MKVYDSFHLAGQYHRDYFPAPEAGSRSAFDERLQYGAVKLRARPHPRGKSWTGPPPSARTVLSPGGESLLGPDELRRERLGDDNHLVLLVRNSRTGQTSWLALSSGPPNGLQVTTKLAHSKQGVQRQMLDAPFLPSSGLACPMVPRGEPAYSYPLFIGGEAGSRLVEIWIVQNRRSEDLFAGARCCCLTSSISSSGPDDNARGRDGSVPCPGTSGEPRRGPQSNLSGCLLALASSSRY